MSFARLRSALCIACLSACSGSPEARSSGTPDYEQDGNPAQDGDSLDPPDQEPDDGQPDDGEPEPEPPRECEKVEVAAEPREPDILIVLDRSESMEQEFQGGLFPVQTMRWEPAVSAIEQVTAALDQTVRFGLMVFPNEADRCAAGALEVPIALGAAPAIALELAGHQPGGATPLAITLGEALAVVTADRALPDVTPHDKYLLLVTDGNPNCSASLSSSNDLDDLDSYAAMDRLREADVKSYVVGFDTGGLEVLDGLAQRGGTGETSHRAVSDGAGLVAELSAISGTLVSCTYALEKPVSDARYVRVQIDGESYPLGAAGWTLEGDSTVKLEEPACAVLRDGMSHRVEITVECDPVVLL